MQKKLPLGINLMSYFCSRIVGVLFLKSDYMRFFLLFIIPSFFLCSIPSTLHAQIFRARSDTSAVTWKVRYVTDIGFQVVSKTEHDFYDGEKLYFDMNSSYWKWTTSDTSIKGPSALEKVSSVRMGVLLNIVDNLYLGFSYTPLIIRRYKSYYDDQGHIIGSNLETVPLFSLGGTVAYDYNFPFYKRLTLQPSVTIGGYQSNASYEGPGRELFYEGRMGLAFRPFKYNQLRVWCAYQGYSYRENAPSYVFDKNRTVKTDVNAFVWGMGYSFNINIVEDFVREQKQKKEKRNK